jgi:hypothetical protein
MTSNGMTSLLNFIKTWFKVYGVWGGGGGGPPKIG